MKRKIIFLLSLTIIGMVSYFGGYYMYCVSHPQMQMIEPVSVRQDQNTAQPAEDPLAQKYFLVKSDHEMLMIYEMPDGTIYDSVKLNSLFLPGKEEMLQEGMVFQSLPEVFEFLENSMS